MSETAVATMEMSNPLAREDHRMIGPRAVALRDLKDVERFATLIYKSNLVPKEYRNNLGDVVGVIAFGLELGLNPMQALQNIAWINSKPSVYGDMMLALIEASGLLEEFDEVDPDEAVHTGLGRCTVKRRGRHAITRTFSKGDAEMAKLWTKDGPWKQYPGRMLQMRARSWALRDAFSDVLKGLIAREEAQDIIDVTPASMPQPVTREPDPSQSDDEVHAFLIEQITAAFKTAVAGLAGREKIAKVTDLLDACFGIKGWSKLEGLPNGHLEAGYQHLLELTTPSVETPDEEDVPDFDDSPISDVHTAQTPQDERSDVQEPMDSHEVEGSLLESASDPDGEIPEPEVDEDGLVTKTWADRLAQRAEQHHNTLLLMKIQGEAAAWTVGQWKYAWVQVGPKPVKAKV